MWTFLKLGTSFLPRLGGIWIYLAVALVASFGTYKVEHWRGLANTAAVQLQFDNYKLLQLQAVNEENARVVAAMNAQLGILQSVTTKLASQRLASNKTSQILIERLTNANGKSCTLSPAIVEYLNSVRGPASTPSN